MSASRCTVLENGSFFVACHADVFKAAIQGNKAFVNETLAKLQGHATDEVVLRVKQLQKELKETEE